MIDILVGLTIVAIVANIFCVGYAICLFKEEKGLSAIPGLEDNDIVGISAYLKIAAQHYKEPLGEIIKAEERGDSEHTSEERERMATLYTNHLKMILCLLDKLAAMHGPGVEAMRQMAERAAKVEQR